MYALNMRGLTGTVAACNTYSGIMLISAARFHLRYKNLSEVERYGRKETDKVKALLPEFLEEYRSLKHKLDKI